MTMINVHINLDDNSITVKFDFIVEPTCEQKKMAVEIYDKINDCLFDKQYMTKINFDQNFNDIKFCLERYYHHLVVMCEFDKVTVLKDMFENAKMTVTKTHVFADREPHVETLKEKLFHIS